MKTLVFDTSSIITIVTNNMIDVIKSLKRSFNGEFYITPNVKIELIDKPLHSKVYSLEAMMVSKLIEEGYLKILKPKSYKEIELLSNSSYSSNNKNIKILQAGEIEALALAVEIQADAFVIDERTTRVLIEEPRNLRNLLQRKLHTNIQMNSRNVREISKITKGIKVIRSAELAFIAFEKGLLHNYISDIYPKKEQIDALLWGMRTKGCSISTDEIESAKRL